MKKESLWNLTKNKTREIIEYIDSIELKYDTSEKGIDYFKKVMKKVKSAASANEMLELIGYNYGYPCNLIQRCNKM